MNGKKGGREGESSVFMTPGSAFLPASGGEEQGTGGHLSLPSSHQCRGVVGQGPFCSCPSAGSPEPPPLGSALLCCPGKMQGLLSQVLHLLMTMLMTLWAAFLNARVSSPTLVPWSGFIHTPTTRGRSIVLPGQGTLQSAAACELWGQLSRVVQPVMGGSVQHSAGHP